MGITNITSLSQLNGILSKAGDKLSVIDFHATWCGPCHMIAPTFEALSKEFTNVNFLRCDVDEAKDVASHYRIQAMPTFKFIKKSDVVETIKGANRNALESTVRKLASGASTAAAFGGSGQTLGGNSSPKPAQPGSTVPAFWTNLDPQAKSFVLLLAAYFVFWYFG
ncbi:thioredoxin-domain-containing protein [Trametopsis cervina]|nr:thioredoxin-domain-containing protein [Trametopsis cervina]